MEAGILVRLVDGKGCASKNIGHIAFFDFDALDVNEGVLEAYSGRSAMHTRMACITTIKNWIKRVGSDKTFIVEEFGSGYLNIKRVV